MLINLGEQLKKYNIEPKGVIHVGAHWAEEHDDYVSYGTNHFLYIEPCKEAFVELKKRIIGIDCECYNNRGVEECHIGATSIDVTSIKSYGVINCACGREEREMVMYVSHNNQGQSNSLLEPHLHLEQHKEVVFDDVEVVKVKTLDSLVPVFAGKCLYNILAMDVQGYEGEVLKGATETLKHIDVVYTEINRGSTYVNNALVEDIDLLLIDFDRVATYWPSEDWTWGDAIYVRKKLTQNE